ncbi:gamma-glutamylcyclotransferase family protein [Oceanibium sediminis]|uniref:gamma-glutamylcyclotransferase family protein n=1 Tax=Oceanibium sediminis TaxID=2026339 RepID=UPI000DD3199A|nr:gamma-glutamylcyclotransferase family protein [Oceanibium sediminis]
MLYFAYGSNLLTHRLLARCPSARVHGTARLAGHRVTFEKYSFIDGSGKATLRSAPGAEAHGVLYALPDAELAMLDAIEGVGKGYDRVQGISVQTAAGSVTATTYIASDLRAALAPFDWYLALIFAGAEEHGLSHVTASLRATPTQADPVADRPVRLAALAALTAGGHRAEDALRRAASGQWGA